NGIKDISENGLQNWWIKISGNGNDSVLTDESGVYSFDSLLAGNYVVSAKLQEGWSQTFPSSPGTYLLTISSGTTFSGNDFGVFQSSSITGMKFFDGNANGAKDEGENGIANWKILLSGDKTDSLLTDANGNYTFGSLLAGNYTVSEVNQDGWQQTFPAFPGTYSVTLAIGENATEKDFGNFSDTLKLRTFNFSVELSKKAAKLKFSKDSVLKESPNLATAVEAVFAKIGKSGATFLGVPQTDAALAKQYAWIFYKKAMDLGKLFTSMHRGLAMPLDSLRTGTKTIKLSKAIKADRKKYDNVGIEQGVLFNLNLKASELGITPTGLGSLLLDTNVILAGRSLQDSSLAYIGKLFDSIMTYPQQFEITNSYEYVKLSIFADSILRHLNNAFAQTLADSNFRIDTNGVIVGKNSYALYLKGTRLTKEVGLLKRNVGKSSSTNFMAFGATDTPENFSLMQNYPNPFNPLTTIHYALPTIGVVTLKIYNVLGQEVATLLNNEELEEGLHEVQFDASRLSSGVYFYRLTVVQNSILSYTETKKMILLK
ncbi:MAG: T9SS type A sorting domain-containing protein, partial [Ignavibacteria bacterium]|nr:T9SS type A sorting domain-containing protein [Ignavibacteria bacterium]